MVLANVKTKTSSIDTKSITVESGEAGRLDKFLAARMPDMSRSRLQGLIEDGHVTLGGEPVDDGSRKVKAGERYHVVIPEPTPTHMEAQEIPLDVVYEDDDLLVINKPAGLTVHPGPGHPDMTLVNALLAHCGESLSGIGGVTRPGIVHRIDKDTSGLLIVAKNDAAHFALSSQLAERSLSRKYQAICWQVPKQKSGTITGNISRSFSNRQKMAVVKSGGKPAVTHYAVKQAYGNTAAFLECALETGRTHQIRVHMAHLGHPLVGDQTYGAPAQGRFKGSKISDKAKQALLAFPRQALHAAEIQFTHPTSGKQMKFSCKLPDDFQSLVKALGTI